MVFQQCFYLYQRRSQKIDVIKIKKKKKVRTVKIFIAAFSQLIFLDDRVTAFSFNLRTNPCTLPEQFQTQNIYSQTHAFTVTQATEELTSQSYCMLWLLRQVISVIIIRMPIYLLINIKAMKSFRKLQICQANKEKKIYNKTDVLLIVVTLYINVIDYFFSHLKI